eukprot:scaffold114413_cov31-Prasinocladus_malaysianus.AAC.1
MAIERDAAKLNLKGGVDGGCSADLHQYGTTVGSCQPSKVNHSEGLRRSRNKLHTDAQTSRLLGSGRCSECR